MFKKLTFFVIFISSSLIFAQAEEEVIVTGSYIKGSPTDGASPVEIYDRDLIENIGAINVADITANLAVNSGSENNPDSFTSGALQGRTNVNLRGLGLTSTLVLIDGRRSTYGGGTANDGSVFVDTSQIPTIALERVEVLKEGAASIYGSDAIAGVVNYIFRRDFEGFEVDITRQQIDAFSGSKDDRISFIYGGVMGNANVVFAYSSLDRSAMPGSVKNLAPMGVSGLGTTFLWSDGLTTTAAPAAADDPLTAADETVDTRAIMSFTDMTDTTHPWFGTDGTYREGFIGDPNCAANGGLVGRGVGGGCGFAFGPRFNIVNEENHQQTYASIQLPLDNGVELNFDALVSETDVWDNPQSPSYPALSYMGGAAVGLGIGPGQGGNPFDQTLTWFGRPLGSAYPSPDAPRTIDRERISLGATGTFDNGFDWDFRVTRTNEDAYFLQPDTGTTNLQNAIVNNTFDLFVPANNTAAEIAAIASNQETDTFVELDVVDFVITGQVGDVSIASGIQLRDESIDIDRSANSTVTFDANGNLAVPANMIFLGGGIEVEDSKSAQAIFVEAAANVTDNLEIRGAVRYESLEDDSTVDPKISLRYQATDDLVLRASVSSSFREATLAQLYASGVGLQGIQDICGIAGQCGSPSAAVGAPHGQASFIRIAQAANPNLEPEEADNLNIGLIWSPTDSLQAKLDYWAIDYTNVITIESAQGLVVADPTGSQVIRVANDNGSNNGGTLSGVTTNYINAAFVDTDGFDLELSYDTDLGPGILGLGANVSHIMSYEIPVSGVRTDVVGLFNAANFARSLPDTKAVFSANYLTGPHSAAAYVRYVSDYRSTAALTAAATASGLFNADNSLDEFVTVDLRYAYEMSSEDITISLGVKNAFDEDVPYVFDTTNWSYDPKHHDPRGRMFTLGINYNL